MSTSDTPSANSEEQSLTEGNDPSQPVVIVNATNPEQSRYTGRTPIAYSDDTKHASYASRAIANKVWSCSLCGWFS